MNRFVLFVFFFACACSSISYPEEVEETLRMAGKNRKELLKVLKHYSFNPEDSLKLRAASYLIEHMKWHYSPAQLMAFDTAVYRLHEQFEQLYDSIVGEATDEELRQEEVRNALASVIPVTRNSVAESRLDTPVIHRGYYPDAEVLTSDFIISHIDHAFRMWKESPYAAQLSYDDFLEYILPYRALYAYPFFENGAYIYRLFGKILNKTTSANYRGIMCRYNHYVLSLAEMFGHQGFPPIGIYDLFLDNSRACVPIANNGCQVFRAYGIPVSLEYNLSFRSAIGRHYYCALLDSAGNWQRFNPESYYYDSISPIVQPSMNLYRSTYAAQTDAPYFLKEENEVLPELLASPCIKDVTAEVYEVTDFTLDFDIETNNNLAYLYVFKNSHTGLIPASWGVINQEEKNILFKNVLYDVLYFPVYMQKASPVVFGEPFYIKKDDSDPDVYKVKQLFPDTLPETRGDLIIHRKFPVKDIEKKIAAALIGTRFEGANSCDFADAKTLYRIEEAPQPIIQEYIPKTNMPLRYFRTVLPDNETNSLDINRVEFLVRKTDKPEGEEGGGYYVLPAVNDTILSVFNDDRITQLFHNEEAVSVEKIRFMPLNADNAISPGDIYELCYWEHTSWKKVGSQQANDDFLQFSDLPLNRLFWLRNINRGQEELPFIYRDGKQYFLYYDFLISAPH